MRAIYSQNVVFENEIRPATIILDGERIEDISHTRETSAEDFGDQFILPGLIDTHVHINEPGRTDWEGFETATHAAAIGGITSLVDMPLNCLPVTTSATALQTKMALVKNKLTIDCGFWGGVVPGNTHELEPMMKAGALGFKAFLIDSGIPEFPAVTEKDLRQAMPILAAANKPLLVHAELSDDPPKTFSGSRYSDFLASRPKDWENKAIQLMIRLARETKCQVHIVHLSSAEALKDIERAKMDGVKITAETCPHYLCLSSEQIPDGDARFKCAPPIREKENQDRLWQGLKSGIIDFIVSDHSPCAPALKKLPQKDLATAWGGISSLSFALPLLWREMTNRGFQAPDLSRWLSAGPAALMRWSNQGGLRKGHRADLCIFDAHIDWTATPQDIAYKHPLSPYLGRSMRGRVSKTILRGSPVQSHQRLLDGHQGKVLV